MAAEFEKLDAARRWAAASPTATLRVWAPQGAQVLFVRQVAPTVEDLTARRQEVNPLTGAYPTGSWGDESRDYHVAVRLPAKAVGQEQLAARVQLARRRRRSSAQGLVKATWSNDDTLTTRINPAVAHYTGQAELAEAIQDGLAAKAAGDDETATAKLGRAVQLAAETGNDEATSRLRKVVDIDDAEHRHGPAAPRGRQAGRDGARHRLDQDHPGQEVTPTAAPGTICSADDHVPAPTATPPAPTTTATPAARRSPPPAPSTPPLRHRSAPSPPPHRAPHRLRAAAAPAAAGRRDLPVLLDRQPGRVAVLRGLRLRLHHRHDAAAARRRGRAERARPRPGCSPAPDASASRGRHRTPDAPAPRAHPAVRSRRPRWPRRCRSSGWPRCGSTPTGTPRRRARSPARRRACRSWCRCPRRSVLVGRPSASRSIHPDIDCSGDIGVSRRQAQLTTDGQRWWVEDLQSANGTYVGAGQRPAAERPAAARPATRARRGRPDLPRRVDPPGGPARHA